MKNILLSCLILALSTALFSCEGGPTVKPRLTEVQGKMSIRVINKNDDGNVPYSPYQIAYSNIYWISSPDRQMVNISTGGFDIPTLNLISRGFHLNFVRDMRVPASCYKASVDEYKTGYQTTEFFDALGFGIESRATSLNAANSSENLTFTKDDANSLEGNFRVRLRAVGKNTIDTITVEGKFSFPKGNLFVDPR